MSTPPSLFLQMPQVAETHTSFYGPAVAASVLSPSSSPVATPVAPPLPRGAYASAPVAAVAQPEVELSSDVSTNNELLPESPILHWKCAAKISAAF